MSDTVDIILLSASDNVDIVTGITGPQGPAGATGATGAAGPAGITLEVSATYAAITASTAQRLVYVSADETNNGDATLYIHNGTALKFLQTIA